MTTTDLSDCVHLLSKRTNHASLVLKIDVRRERHVMWTNVKVLLCSHFVWDLNMVLYFLWIIKKSSCDFIIPFIFLYNQFFSIYVNSLEHNITTLDRWALWILWPKLPNTEISQAPKSQFDIGVLVFPNKQLWLGDVWLISDLDSKWCHDTNN